MGGHLLVARRAPPGETAEMIEQVTREDQGGRFQVGFDHCLLELLLIINVIN